jgi:GMP synthase-like glutamine amidotransferase
MRALLIEHEDDIPGGLVDDWLLARGAEVDVYRIATDGRDAPDPREYDLIVTLGSEAAAFDDTVAWMERERRLLRAAADGDVPVLGICFGGQLLARVLGGEARRAERREIAWVTVDSRDRSLIEDGPWLQWHSDTFTLPPGAELLADGAVGPAAFVLGRCLGLQFHPEVTPELVEAWVAGSRDELEREGVDPERLLAESREHDAGNRARTLALLDRFVTRVARIDGTAT